MSTLLRNTRRCLGGTNYYGVKDGAKLPKAAIEYLRFISDFLQVEIGMISTGPERTYDCAGGYAAGAVYEESLNAETLRNAEKSRSEEKQ